MNHVTARRVLDEHAEGLLIKEAVPPLEANAKAPVFVRDADSGEPILVIDRYPADRLAEFRHACLTMQMSSTVRTAGVRNASRSFGFVSRSERMQRNSCKACSSSMDSASAHAAICASADPLFDLLTRHVPDQAKASMEVAEKVLPEWRLTPTTPWTSGVLNKTSALPYHYDRNNLEPVWSAMVVVRRQARGGHLHIPAYNLTAECRDGDVLMFPGYQLVHGVTPIRLVAADAYRFSAVFYCVSAMANCRPFEEEFKAGLRSRTRRDDDVRSNAERLGLVPGDAP